ncbi:hypothetical protein BV22DRAFT_1131770 [Leucogyrophana mollusca]|uniref:Uncharacterized protein n=1 Tax=Leucogyrophana mollusca TaxID=85980 RepID=A0ACB8BAY8_9AGAM|nr:hypothetical protein BV22DRAFT_1131770 [Leucogyrophana mollusca]
MVAPKSAIVIIVASIAVLVAADCEKLYLPDKDYSIALYDTADCRKTPKSHSQIITGIFSDWKLFDSCHCHDISPSLNDGVKSFVFQGLKLTLYKDVGCPKHGKALAAAPDIVVDADLFGPDPYDLNFIYPVPKELSTSKLKLVPFIPRLHGEAFLEGTRGKESMFKLMPLALEGPGDFLRFVESFMRRDNLHVLFAIIDTTRPDTTRPTLGGSLAGVIGLVHTRTHVGSHAVGLMLRWAFELPSAASPGLGMRRVTWITGLMNAGSSGLAMRMGFKYEGLMRWACGMPEVEGYPKEGGKPSREGDPLPGLQGRDSLLYAQCWDDWEGGGRELVERAFARVV